jgi:hypothetical protein
MKLTFKDAKTTISEKEIMGNVDWKKAQRYFEKLQKERSERGESGVDGFQDFSKLDDFDNEDVAEQFIKAFKNHQTIEEGETGTDGLQIKSEFDKTVPPQEDPYSNRHKKVLYNGKKYR